MNSKQYVRKWRAKLAEDPEKLAAHLARERTRDKFRREKKKELLSQSTRKQLENKRISAERKRKYRAKKKEAERMTIQHSLPTKAYNCPQTLAKAVKKVKLALPDDPLKTKAVLEKLLTIEEIRIAVQPDKPEKTAWNKTPQELKDKAAAFYQRDDISRQAPGIKDTKSIKNIKTGKRESIQKRHLVYTVKEVFEMFQHENPEIKLQKSKFFSLRPKHVMPSSDMPHNVCLCTYHSNIDFILEAVDKVVDEFPKTSRLFLEKVSCDVKKEACMTGACKKCKINDFKGLIPPGTNIQKRILWNQWKKIEAEDSKKTQKENKEAKESQDEQKKKQKKVFKLVPFVKSVEDALNQLSTQTDHFKTHVFVQKAQSKYFQDKKDNVGANEAVLQADFAENAPTKYQDEIQSAYFTQGQVTVFTACAWLRNYQISFAVISDDLTHDKYSVWTFLKVICSELISRFPHLESLFIFTDGCSGQFKSKYVMSNLCYFQQDFNLECEWNFFATSHGKGAVDGIGATVKRAVWQKVRNRKAVVATAEDFYKCANSSIEGIKTFYVPKADIEMNKGMLELRTKSVRSIPSIKSQHHFKYCDSKSLNVGRTCQSKLENFIVIKSPPIDTKCKISKTVAGGKKRTEAKKQKTVADDKSNKSSIVEKSPFNSVDDKAVGKRKTKLSKPGLTKKQKTVAGDKSNESSLNENSLFDSVDEKIVDRERGACTVTKGQNTVADVKSNDNLLFNSADVKAVGKQNKKLGKPSLAKKRKTVAGDKSNENSLNENSLFDSVDEKIVDRERGACTVTKGQNTVAGNKSNEISLFDDYETDNSEFTDAPQLTHVKWNYSDIYSCSDTD